MKQLLIISILSNCFFYETIAQNLVPNYSFENYTTCPNASGQIFHALPWTNPTVNGTPDYYNICSAIVGIPGSSSRFQYPKTGNAYVGIYSFDQTVNNAREYIQVQLIDSLKYNKCYNITFYVNLINWAGKGSNNLGAYISDSAISSTTSFLLNFQSQVKIFNNKILVDTAKWQKIEAIYQSTGNEYFLTIGNFNDDSTTSHITLDTSSPYQRSYYYIDDVSVIPIDSIPGGMPAFAGNDTSIVIGDSVFIGQEITNLNCNWYNSSGTLIASSISGIFVQPTATTYYVVEQNLCGTITYDTVNVTVQPVGVNEFIQKSEAFRIFPNPSTGTIYFQSNNNASNLVSILITDVTGKLVYSNNNLLLNNDISKIDLDVENGVYFIHIQDLNANLKSIKKIVINK
jgi:hypothetical protein